MLPAMAVGLTPTTKTPEVDDGHGMFESTALNAVATVRAPVAKVAVVPVAVAHVGLAALKLVDFCQRIVPE